MERKMPTAPQTLCILGKLIEEKHAKITQLFTPMDALGQCGCFRLSERIRELEALGWEIEHKWVKFPSGKRVMGYRLK